MICQKPPVICQKWNISEHVKNLRFLTDGWHVVPALSGMLWFLTLKIPTTVGIQINPLSKTSGILLFKIRKKLAWLILSLLLAVPLAAAHVEHAQPAVEKTSIWFQVFLFHDWIHPVFFILLIYSCYYFRFFSGRNISHEPKKCLGGCRGCYKPEGKLKQYHRYFFWGTLGLTFVHVGEIYPSLVNFSLFSGLDLGVLVSETAYLGFAFLYLGTCYHFRYFVERLARKGIVGYKLYNGLTALNRYHDIFFWFTIIAVSIRFVLVAVDTGSILQAIPGTF